MEFAFESYYGQHTTLANYAYLDLLDQAWTAIGRPLPQGGSVTDVGCANFWYARTLHTFFRPAKLTGWKWKDSVSTQSLGGGPFFMVNQGTDEAAIAAKYCRQAGLRLRGEWIHPRPLRPRPHPPVASCWTI